MANRSEYLYPQSSYHGDARPETIQFNADLQTFSQRVSFICALGNNGKLTPREAYDQIQELWAHLEPSGKQLFNS
ncbi:MULTISPECIES: hypothetical protein [unclassified Leptolyngbya]|uniref:DUF7219 family protein n=1 Tax=unclassified Leptolyngbya TaxID=2650499 RepID=UPI001688B6BC|nr:MULTISPECIES: hypothetical protein [unclassified Leptolyngbya]MBD1911299.1 hypothetical protein [Leptolyngbya sp. FACHB-8]MBD2156683.1 hypothetical protein [Leptolyngbya sp. FACHB-16]